MGNIGLLSDRETPLLSDDSYGSEKSSINYVGRRRTESTPVEKKVKRQYFECQDESPNQYRPPSLIKHRLGNVSQ